MDGVVWTLVSAFIGGLIGAGSALAVEIVRARHQRLRDYRDLVRPIYGEIFKTIRDLNGVQELLVEATKNRRPDPVKIESLFKEHSNAADRMVNVNDKLVMYGALAVAGTVAAILSASRTAVRASEQGDAQAYQDARFLMAEREREAKRLIRIDLGIPNLRRTERAQRKGR